MNRAMTMQKWVLVSAFALPMNVVLAQPGYSFRPMDNAAAQATDTAPGWRPTTPSASAPPVNPADEHMGYRFAPRQSERQTDSLAPAGDGSFRYKPEQAQAEQPPPLPSAIDPSKESGMQAFAPGSMPSQQGMDQNLAPNLPGRYPMPEPPMRPSYSMERPTRPEPPVRPEPPSRPEPPPLRLESRYIDDPSRYQQHAYPFRPLDEDKPEKAKSSGDARGQAPAAAQGNQYTYPTVAPVVPMAPAYPRPPYDPGYNYNSGPTFNGFRFPFNNGIFPFSFK